jgi:hypothetical protein
VRRPDLRRNLRLLISHTFIICLPIYRWLRVALS